MKPIQPDSIKNYSLKLMLDNASDYAGCLNASLYRGKVLKFIKIRQPSLLGGGYVEALIHIDLDELTPADIGSLTGFFGSQVPQQLLSEYRESEFYPYDCGYVSNNLIKKLEEFNIDAAMCICNTREEFRAGPDITNHSLALILVDFGRQKSHWIIDFSADQHIGPNTLITNAYLPESRKELRRIIQENHIQCTPLVGPVKYFSDLYIFE